MFTQYLHTNVRFRVPVYLSTGHLLFFPSSDLDSPSTSLGSCCCLCRKNCWNRGTLSYRIATAHVEIHCDHLVFHLLPPSVLAHGNTRPPPLVGAHRFILGLVYMASSPCQSHPLLTAGTISSFLRSPTVRNSPIFTVFLL